MATLNGLLLRRLLGLSISQSLFGTTRPATQHESLRSSLRAHGPLHLISSSFSPNPQSSMNPPSSPAALLATSAFRRLLRAVATRWSVALLPRNCVDAFQNAHQADAQAPHFGSQRHPPPLPAPSQVLPWPTPSASHATPHHAPPISNRLPHVSLCAADARLARRRSGARRSPIASRI